MFACTCVSMYVCVSVYVLFLCMGIYIYVCGGGMSEYIYVCLGVCVCMVCVDVWMCLCVWGCIYVCLYHCVHQCLDLWSTHGFWLISDVWDKSLDVYHLWWRRKFTCHCNLNPTLHMKEIQVISIFFIFTPLLVLVQMCSINLIWYSIVPFSTHNCSMLS